jgi:LemA protein
MKKHTRLRAVLTTALTLAIPITTVAQMSGCMCGIKKHDKLIELLEDCNEAWANVEAQYQRRMDLLPNAVKIAKKVAEHESETLTAVTEARASATQVKITAKDLDDPEKMKKFEASQQQVAQSFGKLMHVAEKYPELKADRAFQDLMAQIEGTENRILVARKKYNKAVSSYNKELRIVSGKALDAITGDEMFQPRHPFTAQAGAENAPELDL